MQPRHAQLKECSAKRSLELMSEVKKYGVQSISGWEYHFYNVLWIERKGEIVYRKAAGRVPKVVWEANCTEPVRIILG